MATVKEEDLDRNLKELHRPWSLHQPIETLFIQLHTCRAFAETNDPISEATAVRAGLINLENTASFTEAIREWRHKPVADRTLDNFETHFSAADSERKRTLTTRAAGYHQAATVTENTNDNASTGTALNASEKPKTTNPTENLPLLLEPRPQRQCGTHQRYLSTSSTRTPKRTQPSPT